MKKNRRFRCCCVFHSAVPAALHAGSKTACIYNPWNSHLSLPDCSTARFSVRRSRLSAAGSTLSAALESAEIPAGSPLLGIRNLLALQEPKSLQQLPDLLQQYRLSSGCKLARYHSLAGRSQHGNPAGKPETGRTKRTYA